MSDNKVVNAIENIALWDECFNGMSRGEYNSKTFSELRALYEKWRQEQEALHKNDSDIKCSFEDVKPHLEHILVAIDTIADRNLRRHIDAEVTLIYRKMKGITDNNKLQKESSVYSAMIGEEE